MAAVERKVGVASGDGMRLKARNDRPRLPGTYPRPEAGERENSPRLSSWGRVIVAGSGGEGVFARASIGYMAGGWGDRRRLWNSRGL